MAVIFHRMGKKTSLTDQIAVYFSVEMPQPDRLKFDTRKGFNFT